MTVAVARTNHPAKFPRYVLDELALLIGAERRAAGRPLRILDPFAGVGRIHDLPKRLGTTVGVEIEPEWAGCRRGTVVGDATDLPPGWTETFDVVATSCLQQSHRLLTSDLRWVAAGDVREGDELIGFEEHAANQKATGMQARRRWQRTTVLRSVPRSVECVRVIMANGEEIITTPEHPWLAMRYAYGGRGLEWVQSRNLIDDRREHPMPNGGTRLARSHAYHVLKFCDPWTTLTGYKAGWLAGIFDGEGSISLGAHGSPKMQMCQVLGPVADRTEQWLHDLGINTNRIDRKPIEGRRQITNIYVVDGFAGVMRALGSLRPLRLLDVWDNLDLTTRTVQAERVQVVAVEPAGRHDIQEIETDARTYIGEGYLHHNCVYGNRMSDHQEAADSCARCQGTGTAWTPDGCGDAPMLCPDCRSVACACGGIGRAMRGHVARCPDCRDRACPSCRGSGLSRRYTYRHALGRELSANNAGRMQWGEPYRRLHLAAWAEARRVLRPGGLMLVNVKNHVRGGVEQTVVEWHALVLRRDLGFDVGDVVAVASPGMRNGANRGARVDNEQIIVARRRT